MTKIVLDILNFIVGSFLGFLWFGVIFLPLFYGIPRSIYYAFKGKLKASSIFVYVGSIVIWSIVFIALSVVLIKLFPNYEKYMSITFIIGQWFAVIVSIYRAFISKSGRYDLNEDFWDRMEKYKT